MANPRLPIGDINKDGRVDDEDRVMAGLKPRGKSKAVRGNVMDQAVRNTARLVSTWARNRSGGGGYGDGGGGGYGDGGAAAALARRNQEGKDRTAKEIEALKGQMSLAEASIAQSGRTREADIANANAVLRAALDRIQGNYNAGVASLSGETANNEADNHDKTFMTLVNALRERQESTDAAIGQGAGETDIQRSQVASLENWHVNQTNNNRSFADTLQSINRALTKLNTDTEDQRAAAQLEEQNAIKAAWEQDANRRIQALNQIAELDARGRGYVESEDSTGYTSGYSLEDLKRRRQEAVDQGAYRFLLDRSASSSWDGKQGTKKHENQTSSRAASVGAKGALQTSEGSKLRMDW